MSKVSIEIYENELQHDIKDHETLEDYIYSVSYQQSQYRWHGLERVHLSKAILENDEELYIIEEEDIAELVKLNNKYNDRIRKELIEASETHELGEFQTVAIFDNEEEARKYLEKNYKQINLERELLELLPDNDE